MMALTEGDIRRIVAEELEAGLKRLLAPAAVSAAMIADESAVVSAGDYSPYDLTDAELRMAERLLPPAERPILRLRVMARRLERKNNRRGAMYQWKKADRLERQLLRAV